MGWRRARSSRSSTCCSKAGVRPTSSRKDCWPTGRRPGTGASAQGSWSSGGRRGRACPRSRRPGCLKKSVDDHVAKTADLADATKARYDATAKDLPPLSKGDQVYVQGDADGRWRRRGHSRASRETSATTWSGWRTAALPGATGANCASRQTWRVWTSSRCHIKDASSSPTASPTRARHPQAAGSSSKNAPTPAPRRSKRVGSDLTPTASRRPLRLEWRARWPVAPNRGTETRSFFLFLSFRAKVSRFPVLSTANSPFCSPFRRAK